MTVLPGHHRRSIRFRDYDYSQPGMYFVTLVTRTREPLFGSVGKDRMIINPLGQIIDSKLILKSVMLYNVFMKLSSTSLEVLLEDVISRDRTTARRATLLQILLHERFLTRDQLILRTEGKIGKGCFGDSAWEDTFYRDMLVVKRALSAEGYQTVYSRNPRKPGYYLRNQSSISSRLSAILDGSIAEVDRKQLSIIKQLSFKQRFQQGCSITNLACQTVVNRICQKNPGLNLSEAQCQAIQKKV